MIFCEDHFRAPDIDWGLSQSWIAYDDGNVATDEVNIDLVKPWEA